MSFERALRARGVTVKQVVMRRTGGSGCCAKLFCKTNELRGVSSIAVIGTAESRALPD